MLEPRCCHLVTTITGANGCQVPGTGQGTQHKLNKGWYSFCPFQFWLGHLFWFGFYILKVWLGTWGSFWLTMQGPVPERMGILMPLFYLNEGTHLSVTEFLKSWVWESIYEIYLGHFFFFLSVPTSYLLYLHFRGWGVGFYNFNKLSKWVFSASF